MLNWFGGWGGLFLLAVCDASILFFLPFGVDTMVIYRAARSPGLFWLVPLLATFGSLLGAAATFWIGRTVGDKGLSRFVPARQLERVRNKVRNRGAIALAIPALLPPPFPLTPFILVCGALDVSRLRFFATLGVARLLRFGVEAGLARVYGSGIVRVIESDRFRMVVIAFAVIAVLGTTVSAFLMWRSSKRPQEG